MSSIDREDTIEILKDLQKDHLQFCLIPFRQAIERIQALPSADRPQGKWIDKGDYAECSICGANSGTQFNGVEPVPRKTKFCPNCGARMFAKDTNVPNKKGADDEP